MSKTYTPAKKRAIQKYQSEHVQIKITVDKKVKEKFVTYAKVKGISLTELIIHSVNLEIAQDEYVKRNHTKLSKETNDLLGYEAVSEKTHDEETEKYIREIENRYKPFELKFN